MRTYVYVIACLDRGFIACAPVKVGITSGLIGRASQVQTGNHNRICTFFSVALPERKMAEEIERCFHGEYSSQRLSGEWFQIPPIEAAISLVAMGGEHIRNFAGNRQRRERMFIDAEVPAVLWGIADGGLP